MTSVSQSHDPDEDFSMAARDLAWQFLTVKVKRGIIRSRVYADGQDVGPELPPGEVILVTVELVPEKQLLDEQGDIEENW